MRAPPSLRRVLAAIAPAPTFATDVAIALYGARRPPPYRLGEVLAVLRSLERSRLARSRRARHASRPIDRMRRLFAITRRGRRALALMNSRLARERRTR